MNVAAVVVAVAAAAVVALLVQKLRQARRAEFIRHYAFPRGLLGKLQQRRGLTDKDAQLVAHALRQYFLAHLQSGRRFVSMPSQVADDLWHEFILYTRGYADFCRRAFGQFMHHTPAVALAPAQRQSNAGLRRTWWYCCREENINPRKPLRLPLLFALDAKLGVADGFRYVPDCSALRAGGDGSAYCGGDFGSGSTDGSTDGFGNDGNGGGHGFGGGDGGGSDGGGSDGGGDGGGGGCGGGSD